MKYRALRFAAFSLAVLAGLVAVTGLVISALIGINAATVATMIGFTLGGFIITGLSAIILFAVSRLIYLFIDIEGHLARLAMTAGRQQGD